MFANSRNNPTGSSLGLQSDPPTDPEPFRMLGSSNQRSFNRSLAAHSDLPTDVGSMSEGLPPVDTPHGAGLNMATDGAASSSRSAWGGVQEGGVGAPPRVPPQPSSFGMACWRLHALTSEALTSRGDCARIVITIMSCSAVGCTLQRLRIGLASHLVGRGGGLRASRVTVSVILAMEHSGSHNAPHLVPRSGSPFASRPSPPSPLLQTPSDEGLGDLRGDDMGPFIAPWGDPSKTLPQHAAEHDRLKAQLDWISTNSDGCLGSMQCVALFKEPLYGSILDAPIAFFMHGLWGPRGRVSAGCYRMRAGVWGRGGWSRLLTTQRSQRDS